MQRKEKKIEMRKHEVFKEEKKVLAWRKLKQSETVSWKTTEGSFLYAIVAMTPMRGVYCI